nr:DUF4931 domain-containing protein [uncultured Cellulosilyticum sp.]
MMEYYDEILLNNCIIAEGRRRRPMIDEKALDCPFCFPHEGVVILENKYPVADAFTDPYGIHDVIVDTPYHHQAPKDFSKEQWEEILLKMQQRFHEVSKDDKVKFIQIFKNYGAHGGASISHSHWQILALSKVPEAMHHQYAHYQQSAGCYLCGQVEKAIALEYKIVETTNWIICSPKAPRFAYEIIMMPKQHYQHYGQLPEQLLKEVSHLLKKVLIAYDVLQPGCSYNICMMGGALDLNLDYHFHIKVAMRLGNMAGFELATGCFINMVSPEHAVAQMKKLLKE